MYMTITHEYHQMNTDFGFSFARMIIFEVV